MKTITFTELAEMLRVSERSIKSFVKRFNLSVDQDQVPTEEVRRLLHLETLPKKFLLIEEVQEMLQLNRGQVIYLYNNGDLKSYNPIKSHGSALLFLESNVQEYLDNKKKEAEKRKAEILQKRRLKREEKVRQEASTQFIQSLFFIPVRLLTNRESDILRMFLLEECSFQKISETFDLPEKRSKEVFEKALIRLNYRSNVSFNNLLKELDDLRKKNSRLNEENRKLQQRIEAFEYELQKENPQFKIDPKSKKIIVLPLFKYLIEDASVRLSFCLKAAEITTTAQVLSYKKSEYLKFRKFGRKTLEELENLLKKYGLQLEE
jgi:hypothetical protein